MKLLRLKHLGEAGDTLIEVTIALTILTVVLSTTTLLATRAMRLGVTARERTSISDEAQAQMEAVRAFRDNHTWKEFLDGSGSSYKGVRTAGGSDCEVTDPCMHMELATVSGSTFSVPVFDGTKGTVPTSYIEIVVKPAAGTIPAYVDVTVNYGFKQLGGGTDAAGHIQTKLSNIRANDAATVATNSAPSTGALFGAPGPPLTGGTGGTQMIWGRTFQNQSPLPASEVAGCTWDFGDTNPPVLVASACIPGDTIRHNFPVGVTTSYTVTLTERNINGSSAQFILTVNEPRIVACTPSPSDPTCVPD